MVFRFTAVPVPDLVLPLCSRPRPGFTPSQSPCQESLERSELAVNFGAPKFWAPLPLFINFPFVCCLYYLF